MDTPLRKIIHIDMDAFFAAIEQRDNPSLRGKPIAVGSPERRGVVATASYEARRFGVRSAMPSVIAAKRCPGLIFVKGNYEKYKAVSMQIMDIFREYTDLIEPLSIDEAFLDVTANKPGITLAVEIAREIKSKIRERLSLVASAGVSYNKFLAKIASDYRKPDGLCTIHPSQALEFIDALPIESFWGVGPVTAERMHRLGINNGADLRSWSMRRLVGEFGKAGPIYYNFARGIDNRPVCESRVRKSIGCERTLEYDISDDEAVDEELCTQARELAERIARKSFAGNTLTLKIKFADFVNVSRSLTRGRDFYDYDDIISGARQLVDNVDYGPHHEIRLIGLTVSNPHGLDGQQLYFEF